MNLSFKNIAVGIQARLNSKRFPQKMEARLANLTLLEWIFKRLKIFDDLSNLYLLTSGDDLWNRINCLEGELEFDYNEKNFNLDNTNIEKIFGKFEANFQKLIEENIYKEGINCLLYTSPSPRD